MTTSRILLLTCFLTTTACGDDDGSSSDTGLAELSWEIRDEATTVYVPGARRKLADAESPPAAERTPTTRPNSSTIDTVTAAPTASAASVNWSSSDRSIVVLNARAAPSRVPAATAVVAMGTARQSAAKK